MLTKARHARSLAASVCTTGTDIQAPSGPVKTAYNHALKAAIRPKGNKWVEFWTLMAVCVPGHALEIDAITQRESFLGLRRQVNRDGTLCGLAQQLQHQVQTLFGGGACGAPCPVTPPAPMDMAFFRHHVR